MFKSLLPVVKNYKIMQYFKKVNEIGLSDNDYQFEIYYAKLE